jgi:hypothetical protein
VITALFGSPKGKGTFTLNQVRSILSEAKKLETVNHIAIESGSVRICSGGVGFAPNIRWRNLLQPFFLPTYYSSSVFLFSIEELERHQVRVFRITR